MSPEVIIAVIGPTAVGKSDFAVALACSLKKMGHDAEIISADSRQVYTGLDIGSGKITQLEMHGIRHHLLNVANPKDRYSVADFVKDATKAIEDIRHRNAIPIVCGGTGLYIDTLLSGTLLPEVAPNKKLRAHLATKTTTQLYTMLNKLDPIRAKSIDTKNPVRLIRAIEIAKKLGSVPSVSQITKYKTLYIGIDLPDEILKSTIRVRLEKRIAAGMVDEVISLHKQGVSWKRLEELGLEYRYCAYVLQKKMTKSAMLTELEKEIWQYAKRQRTWWKRNKEIVWIR